MLYAQLVNKCYMHSCRVNCLLFTGLPGEQVLIIYLVTVIDNKGGQVDTFILNFEKAFDTPSHELLKCKLYGYGIGGKTLKWIDSFLCDRQQCVMVNGVKSDWARFVGCPPGHRSWTSVILVIH